MKLKSRVMTDKLDVQSPKRYMQRDVDWLAENGRKLKENIEQQQLVVLSKFQDKLTYIIAFASNPTQPIKR